MSSWKGQARYGSRRNFFFQKKIYLRNEFVERRRLEVTKLSAADIVTARLNGQIGEQKLRMDLH